MRRPAHWQMIDPGEALLAAIGFSAVWNEGETAFPASAIRRATELPHDVAARVRNYLRGGTAQGNRRKLPELDWGEIHDLLTTTVTPEALARRVQGAPGESEAPLMEAITRARDYLLAAYPGRQVTTLAGVTTHPGGTLETMRLRRAWAVASDPIGAVFSDLDHGCLTTDQSIALQAIFPTIWQTIAETVFLSFSDAENDGKPWRGSRLQERQLRTLLQVPSLTVDLQRALQSEFAGGDDAPSPRGGTFTGGERTQTPTQRIQAK